jgi:hypothetical protein
MRTRHRTRRPVHQAHHPVVRVLPQPQMNRLTAHPIPSGDSHHRRPIQHLMHRRHPLIHDPQLHQHDRPSRPRRSGSTARQPRRVTHQPDPPSPRNRTHRRPATGPASAKCHPRTGAAVSTMNRNRTSPRPARANGLLTELPRSRDDSPEAVDGAAGKVLVRAHGADSKLPDRFCLAGLGPGVRKDVGVRVSPLAPI